MQALHSMSAILVYALLISGCAQKNHVVQFEHSSDYESSINLNSIEVESAALSESSPVDWDEMPVIGLAKNAVEGAVMTTGFTVIFATGLILAPIILVVDQFN